jgi:hypothetical protein
MECSYIEYAGSNCLHWASPGDSLCAKHTVMIELAVLAFNKTIKAGMPKRRFGDEPGMPVFKKTAEEKKQFNERFGEGV